MVVREVVGEDLGLLAGAPLGEHVRGAVPRQGGGGLTHLENYIEKVPQISEVFFIEFKWKEKGVYHLL